MEREFFLKTNRIGFSRWTPEDFKLAELLWGDPEVTKYICASGIFSGDRIFLLCADGLVSSVL